MVQAVKGGLDRCHTQVLDEFAVTAQSVEKVKATQRLALPLLSTATEGPKGQLAF
jgi:hypothetical protein